MQIADLKLWVLAGLGLIFSQLGWAKKFPHPLVLKPIKVAYLGNFSGSEYGHLASYGLEIMQMVFEKANAKGGICGRPIQLAGFDAQNFAQNNVKIFNRLVELNYDLVSGVHGSNEALLIAPLAEQHKLPLISLLASNPNILKNHHYVLQAGFDDYSQAEKLSSLVTKTLKSKELVLVTNITSHFSLFLSSQIKKNLQGRLILHEIETTKADRNFKDVLLQLKLIKNFDTILFTTQIGESFRVIDQLAAKPQKINFVGTDNWNADEVRILSQNLELNQAFYFITNWAPQSLDTRWDSVRERLMKKFNISVTTYLNAPAMAFDVAQHIVKSLAKCPQGAQAMMQALKSSTSSGISGTLSFNSKGKSNQKAHVAKMTRGVYENI